MIKDHQAQYYHALEQADEQASSNVFIHFMLRTITKTLAQALTPNAPVNITGLKTTEALQLLLQHNPHLMRQQLAEVLGKDLRTISRAISKLQETNQLKRIGSDKTGYWQVQSQKAQS